MLQLVYHASVGYNCDHVFFFCASQYLLKHAFRSVPKLHPGFLSFLSFSCICRSMEIQIDLPVIKVSKSLKYFSFSIKNLQPVYHKNTVVSINTRFTSPHTLYDFTIPHTYRTLIDEINGWHKLFHHVIIRL